MDEETMQKLHRRLLEEAEALETAEEETAGARAPVELDQTSVGRLSRMDAMQMQAMANAQSRRRKQAAARVKAALARVETDEYGDCLKCGEEIELGRLELDPATPLCLACAGGGGGRD
jgi:DnaK suppressor protein